MSKFCSNCGVQVTDESVFCPHCGARFETDFQQPYQAPTDTQYQQPYQAQPNNQYQQPYANPTPYGQYPQQNSYQPRPYYQQAKPKVPGRGFGITSMVLGIIACGIVVLSAILFTATGHMITSGGINYYYSY